MRERYIEHVSRVIRERFENDMQKIINNPKAPHIDQLIKEHFQRTWGEGWKEANVKAFKSNLELGGADAENNAILLVKEKTKRNDYEKESFNFILKHSPPLIMDETKNLGNQEIYLYRGKFLSRQEVKHLPDRPKSLDFRFGLNTISGRHINIYVTHKYTKQGGGSQDNQFSDIKKTLDNAEGCCDNLYIVAVCDGNYFIQTDKNGNTKFDELKRNYEENNGNVFIHTTDTFIDFLHDLYNDIFL